MATLATISEDEIEYEDFVVCARRLVAELKGDGAEIVIALTHMRVPNDRKLAEEVPELDLILGGHDHHYEAQEWGPHRTYILKSGIDSET